MSRVRSTSIDRAAVAARTPRFVVRPDRSRGGCSRERPQPGPMFDPAWQTVAFTRFVPSRSATPSKKRTSRSAAVDPANIGTGSGSPRSRRVLREAHLGNPIRRHPGARDAGVPESGGRRDPSEFWTPVCQNQAGRGIPPCPRGAGGIPRAPTEFDHTLRGGVGGPLAITGQIRPESRRGRGTPR